MQQKESYDVLRLIEHGQICYISSENVQGRTQTSEYHYKNNGNKRVLLSKRFRNSKTNPKMERKS